MDVHGFVDWAGTAAELCGVVTMLVGAFVALGMSAVVLLRRDAREAYEVLRHGLGRAILLGLEFLVAADIIRTVSEMPTLRTVVVLGLVVLIRTFLSFTLKVELDGYWPWQKHQLPARSPEAARAPG